MAHAVPDTRLSTPSTRPSPTRGSTRLAAALLPGLAALALVACGGGAGGETSTDPLDAAIPVTPPITSPAAPAPDSSAGTTTETPAVGPQGLRWRGVNLSGAEFNSTALPGRYGFQYFYPSVSAVDYYQSRGMNLIRLPFLWERLQPTLHAPLDATELDRLAAFVNGATARGMTVMLDPHNYGRYRQQAIGSAGVPHAAFGDFWARMAAAFKSNPRVLFGLMNEPYGMATENWVGAANEAIRRIRATGATQTIAVPGNAWSGAYSWAANWYGTPNAQALLDIRDSGNNLVFEVHQYLDSDSSGTSSVCVSGTIGAQRLQVFTDWLRTHGKRGLLGEFAAANNDTCKQALAGMLAHMKTHSDVWAGWTYWVGGAWSSHDMFSIEPVGGVDKPQMQVLRPYLN